MSKLFDSTSLLMDDLPSNATKRLPLPVGEVLAKIAKIGESSGVVKKEGDRKGEPWYRLDFTLEIEDREYLATYGDGSHEKVNTIFGVMIEKTPDGKRIATGENVNVRLGRFREAAGTNGQPLGANIGRYIRIVVEQEQDPNGEPGEMRDKITSVAKA